MNEDWVGIPLLLDGRSRRTFELALVDVGRWHSNTSILNSEYTDQVSIGSVKRLTEAGTIYHDVPELEDIEHILRLNTTDDRQWNEAQGHRIYRGDLVGFTRRNNGLIDPHVNCERVRRISICYRRQLTFNLCHSCVEGSYLENLRRILSPFVALEDAVYVIKIVAF